MAAGPELQVDKLLARLVRRGVDFVVIGGIAGVLHGSAQNTFDLDICFATDDVNVGALGEVLVELKARLRGVDADVPFVPDAATLRRVEVLTLVTSYGMLDVLAAPAAMSRYEDLRSRAERVDIDGVPVLVASLDDLIVMKLAAGRTKDLLAAEELREIARLRRRR